MPSSFSGEGRIIFTRDFTVDEELARRRKVAEIYRSALTMIKHPIQSDGARNPSFSIYPVLFNSRETRDRVQAELTRRGLWSRVYYPYPLHLQPAFSFLGYKPGDFPKAEQACETILALPMDLNLIQQELAIETIKGALGEK